MNVLVWWDRYHFHSFYFYFHSSIFFNPHPNRFAWKHGSPVAPMLSPRPSPVVSTVIHLPWILTSPECPSVKTVWTRNFLNYKFRPFIRTLGILPGPACEDMVTWTSCLCRLWARGSACMSARPWVFRLRKTKQITATWGIPEVLATGVVFFFMVFSPLSSGEQKGVNHAAVRIPALILHPPSAAAQLDQNIVSGGRKSAEKTSWGEGSWNPILYRVFIVSQVIVVGNFWTINHIFRWACWSPKKLKNYEKSQQIQTAPNISQRWVYRTSFGP